MDFFAKKNGKKGEVYIYQEIGDAYFGGISAKSFTDELKALESAEELNIYINSPGGSVFDGITIYNVLKRHKAKKVVYIDGIAASIASIIAMAGDEIKIASNGTIMIHQAWSMAVGTAADMRKSADALELINDTLLNTYVSRTGQKSEDITAWMDAETWMSADEAFARGFATEIVSETNMKASFPLLDKFNNVPKELKQQSKAANVLLARMEMRSKQLSVNARANGQPKAN